MTSNEHLIKNKNAKSQKRFSLDFVEGNNATTLYVFLGRLNQKTVLDEVVDRDEVIYDCHHDL